MSSPPPESVVPVQTAPDQGTGRARRELRYGLAIAVIATPLGVFVAGVLGMSSLGMMGVVAALLVCGAVLRVGIGATWRASAAVTRAFLAPTGSTVPHRYAFSREEALVQRGDAAGALAAYEARIAAEPGDVEARVRAAELYAGPCGDPVRAASLLREARALPGLGAERDIQIANRLIDLYSGPLGEPGRALVELRRLSDRHANTRVGEQARAAIGRLKAELAAHDRG